MAHRYSESDHFDSFDRRTRKASDEKVLSRLKATYGPSGDIVDAQRDTGGAPQDGGKSQNPDGSGDDVPGAMASDADGDEGPHPEGCMCEGCKSDRKMKKHGGAKHHADLSHEEADALTG